MQTKKDFSNFTFRAHYVGELMGSGVGKSNLEKYQDAVQKRADKQDKLNLIENRQTVNAKKLKSEIDLITESVDVLNFVKHIPNLGETCKSRLSRIYTEETTGRIQDIKSKYIEKGLLLEEDAITAYSLFTGKMFNKNKVRENNGFIEGEMDFSEEDTSIDTKVSWDVFTFDATVAKPMNKIYWWQGQCYMWLFGKENHKIVYTLINTPEHLVKREQKIFESTFVGSSENLKQALREIELFHNYDDLALERKIRIYEFQRDVDAIKQIKERVPYLRNYLNNFGKNNYNEES